MTSPSISLDQSEERVSRGRLSAAFDAISHDARLAWAPLAGVVLLAFALNAWHLNTVGLGNTYYAAAVRSMTTSWHNFFFGAFDPGGMITVDKPPVFLWIGAASARVFGYSSWSLLLPSAIAGAATVGLLWIIVRRTFGTFAATVAALTLALTPITVAVDRLNLPEPFFILALVGAAGAIMRSLEEPRGYRWVVLAGLLVGIAFNTKMLAAWIPGPALAVTLLAGASWPWRPNWRPMLGRVAILGVVTLVASASWMVVTDLTPASARPYIGGSTNNTVTNLVFGYNGFGRVDGGQGFGGASRNAPARPQVAPPNRAPGGTAPGGTAPNVVPGAPTDGRGAFGPGAPAAPGGFGAPGAFGGGPGGPGAANGPGGIIAGQPGPFRMIDSANGGQIGWFLSFALLGAALALWLWRTDRLRRGSVVMWLGWVLLYAGVFSYAQGIYHSYYTSALAPGIAALTGIGALAASDLVRRDRRWLLAPVALVLAALALQFHLQDRVPTYYGWLRPWTIVVTGAGLLLMVAGVLRRFSPRLGMALIVAGLLLLPGGWSVSEAANTSLNTTLPQA
ncbi:MAG: glycosyltransferase family 39 protein, partial [Chloroflexota bacterium]